MYRSAIGLRLHQLRYAAAPKGPPACNCGGSLTLLAIWTIVTSVPGVRAEPMCDVTRWLSYLIAAGADGSRLPNACSGRRVVGAER